MVVHDIKIPPEVPMPEPRPLPKVKNSQAIFAVADVEKTIDFYRRVLGFEGQWLWGQPPTFGGANWGKVQIMFCQQRELAAQVEGHQHFFHCDDVDGMYARHQANEAPIIEEIENKPWGMREYVVRDINGYHLRFAGPATYQRRPTARETMPPTIRLVERMATLDEFVMLTKAVGWNHNQANMQQALDNSLFGVVAIDTAGGGEKVVGMLRLIGDSARFFYVQDVMVLPEYQNQKIGSAMMEAVMAWLRQNAQSGTFVGLFTGKPAFYERYGFESGGGMTMRF
jgi:GNAT superfamily N-acetyltransferase